MVNTTSYFTEKVDKKKTILEIVTRCCVLINKETHFPLEQSKGDMGTIRHRKFS